MAKRSCVVRGCHREHYGRGFCNLHYSRMRRTGTVGPPWTLTSPAKHGTIGMYSNHRCRCELCRKANAESHLAYMHRTGRSKPHVPPEHGTRAKFCSGCRCYSCVEANRVYIREWTHKTGRKTPRAAHAEHGTRSCYLAGCRCDACTAANRESGRVSMRRWRERQRVLKQAA